MTLVEIEFFLGIVKYGTFSKAAEKMFITQPALTRKIQGLEKELGYALFHRQKGTNDVYLTPQGREFYKVALKWQRLLEETGALSSAGNDKILRVAGTTVFNHCILPNVVDDFLRMGYQLQVFNTASESTFHMMEAGFYDLAFLVPQDYTKSLPKELLFRPACLINFFVASKAELPNQDGVVSLSELKEEKETFLLWNKDFIQWHAEHFNEQLRPYITLDDISLAPLFLKNDLWMFVSYPLSQVLQAQGAHIYQIDDPPPKIVMYLLTYNEHKVNAINDFLLLLDQYWKTQPREHMFSLL